MPQYDDRPGKFQGGTKPVISRWRLLAAGLATLLVLGLWWWVQPAGRSAEPGERAHVVAQRDATLRAALTEGEAALTRALERAAAGTAGEVPVVGSALEQGLVLAEGEQVIATAGVVRFAGEAPHGYSLIETPLARLLVLRRDDPPRRGQLTLLLDAAPGIPRGGATLADLAGGHWQWGLRHPSPLPDQGAALAAVSAWMTPADALSPARTPPSPSSRLGVFSALALALLWMFLAPTARTRLFGALGSGWLGALSGMVTGGALALLLGATTLCLAGWWRSRRGGDGVPRGVAAAGLIALPWLTMQAADLIVPPVSTAPLWHWFLWQAGLALVLASLVAVVLPGPRQGPVRGAWGSVAFVGLVMVTLIGMERWRPDPGWPAWLPWLQGGSLLLLLLPMRWSTRLRCGAAAAALLAMLATWGVSLERRIDGANADLARLRSGVDAEALAALDEFAVTARQAGATRLDQLYAAWSHARLATLPVPIHLALSDSARRWFDAIALDSVAVAWADLDSLVAVADRHPYRGVLLRDGITYQTLVLPFPGDTVATVTIGPRSRLLAPTRVGRLVGWRPDEPPGYTLTAGPAVAAAASDDGPFAFGRRGRMLRASMPLGTVANGMTVRATIAMASPQPFAVRALLTLLLDVGLILALAWGVQRALSRTPPAGRRTRGRSHRRMLTAALTAFFVCPAMLLTGWSAVQVGQDAAREGQQEVARALGGVEAFRAAAVVADSLPAAEMLQQMAYDIDAELGVYRQGRLIASSTPLLAELGLMPRLLAPLDTLAVALPGDVVVLETAALPVRLGVEAIGDAVGTRLAALLPRGNLDRATEQMDLLLLLLLTALVGGLGAMWVAGRAAQSLSRPIDQLTQVAGAIGRGESVSLPAGSGALVEFAPVFDAMTRMEQDLRVSEAQRAEATAQAARVTAWGEMARQVAHEIKNPLTPMRLGLQHLQRIRADQRPDFAERVGDTADRLLREVERLDRIARAFARYGTPPAPDAPLERIAVAPVVQEVAEFVALASGTPQLVVAVPPTMVGAARQEELIQVLLNLLDNARQAGASVVTVTGEGTQLRLRDDGSGMTPAQVAAAFDPTFSTTSSGTGLGLPIVRRLVEGWGGAVSITSVSGDGTEVLVSFKV